MRSRTTARFRKAFAALSPEMKERAKKAFKLWKADPSHPSLQFKKIHSNQPVFSARISLAYRTLGVIEDDTIIWFWIGSHDDYENLIKSLSR